MKMFFTIFFAILAAVAVIFAAVLITNAIMLKELQSEMYRENLAASREQGKKAEAEYPIHPTVEKAFASPTPVP